MLGHCRCKNLGINWQIKDYSMVPKACGCDYCASKDAAYVAKPGSKFSITVNDVKQYRPHENDNPSPQGEPSAIFHECGFCKELVAVTCDIEGINYGIINVHCLQQRQRFGEAKTFDFVDQTLNARVQSRQQNWSSPVSIISHNATI